MKNIFLIFFIVFLVIASIFILAIFFRGKGSRKSGGQGGVSMSFDGGKKWEKRTEIDSKNSIEGIDVITLIQHPKQDSIFYLGSRGNGVYRTDSKGKSWEKLSANGTFPAVGDVWAIAFDPSRVATLYIAVSGKNGGMLFKSDDGGATFNNIFTTALNAPIYAIALDSSAPRAVYIGTGGGSILKSENEGMSWQLLSTFNTDVSFLVSSPFNNQELYALIKKRGIARSRDGGKTWESLLESLKDFQGSSEGRMLLFDRQNPGHLYYANSYGLLESLNSGDVWKSVSFVEPPRKVPVLAIAQDPHVPSTLFASAYRFLYMSTDSGKTWSMTGLDISSHVSCIVINYANNQEIIVGLQRQ